MGIRVLKGGMMTTVQDLGRTGYQSQGFSVSGVRMFVLLRLQISCWITRKMKQFLNLP